MQSRAARLTITFFIGALLLVISIAPIHVLIDKTTSPLAALLTAMVSVLFMLLLMKWIGRRLDSMWENQPDSTAGKTLRAITDQTSQITIYIVILFGLAYVITRSLYLPPNDFAWPLQPMLTLVLGTWWLGYIIYSLHTLMAVDAPPDRLSKFSIRAIAGAIALSIYFLLPVDWILNSGDRVLALLMGDRDPGLATRHPIEVNATVSWLQSTAIPSIVSIGFGFLTAYVTSLVWYEFYRTVNGAGLDSVRAAREGRDPSRNDFWFNQLKQSKYRVTLVGATLGGWFEKWSEFRPALKEALAKEEMEKVLIILPEPGNSFFWQRRDDEINREKLLREDPIARLANSIEMLCLAFPENKDAKPAEFLTQNDLADGLERLPNFVVGFSAYVLGHVATYESIDANKKFSSELIAALTPGNKGKPKIKVMFAGGSMMGMSRFDSRILYVPYLPGVEDKKCPEFMISAQTPLGSSLERSIDAMEETGIQVTSRNDLMAMAFRLWKACHEKKAPLNDLSGIPAWLLATYDKQAAPSADQTALSADAASGE